MIVKLKVSRKPGMMLGWRNGTRFIRAIPCWRIAFGEMEQENFAAMMSYVFLPVHACATRRLRSSQPSVAQQSIRRIDLVEDAAVSEMHLLRIAPTAEYLIIDCDELHLRKALHIGRIGVLRMARPVVV